MSQAIEIGQLQAQLELNRSSLADSILSKLSGAQQAQPSSAVGVKAPRPANLGVGAKPKHQTDVGRPSNQADARLRGALTAKRKDRDTHVQTKVASDDEEEVGRAAAILSRKKAKSSSSTVTSAKTKDPFTSKGIQAQRAAQIPVSNVVTIDGESIDLSQLSKTQRKKINKRLKESQSNPPQPSLATAVAPQEPAPSSNDKSSGPALTPLQAQMLSKLSGSRFRTINEKLYTTHSREAVQMIDDSPSTFEEYHQGFREQVRSWPKNPLDRVVEMLDPDTALLQTTSGKNKAKAPSSQSTISKFTAKPKARFSASPLIVDLGAGEGGLAKKLVPKGVKVLSFDLLNTRDGWVRRQDSAAIGGLPLPGFLDAQDPLSPNADAQVAQNAPGIVDVAVFCLSLMGTNWVHMILEAKRVLRTGGELIIAEVSSRFDGFETFTSLVQELGFGLEKQDASNTHFVLFEFVKLSAQQTGGASPSTLDELDRRGKHLLKPCLYKRR